MFIKRSWIEDAADRVQDIIIQNAVRVFREENGRRMTTAEADAFRAEFTGEIIVHCDKVGDYAVEPKVLFFFDHSVPGVGFGQWYDEEGNGSEHPSDLF